MTGRTKMFVIVNHCNATVRKTVQGLIEIGSIKCPEDDLYAASMTVIDELLEDGHIMLRKKDKI